MTFPFCNKSNEIEMETNECPSYALGSDRMVDENGTLCIDLEMVGIAKSLLR